VTIDELPRSASSPASELAVALTVASQDRADHSSRLHLIVDLGNYFIAYEVKATAYI